MSHTQLQLTRGTAAEVAVYTGPLAEAIHDTTFGGLHLQDGATPGGRFEIGSLSVAADGLPLMNGAADRGTAHHTARADHVHPVDTSRAPAVAGGYLPLTGGSLSGTLLVTGGINVNGAAAAVTFSDRTTPAHYWSQYSTADVLHIDSDLGGIFSLSRVTGDLAVLAGSIQLAGNLNLGFNVVPNTDNTGNCGLAGKSWANVNSYAYTTASAAALKTDIAEAPSALAVVAELIPKTFRWRDGADTERTNHGFIAEEVAAALGADFGGYRHDDESGHHGIDYAQLTAVLWQAVRELQAEVAALRRGG